MATHETHNCLLCTRGATRAEISYALAEINLEMAASVHHVVNTIMRMRAFRRKNGRLYAWPYNEGSAGSLQRIGFRENPTNILTFVAR